MNSASSVGPHREHILSQEPKPAANLPPDERQDPVHDQDQDLVQAQARAVEQLKSLFLHPDRDVDERYRFVKDERKRLQGGSSDRALFYSLASQLPVETYPLLFCHFGKCLTDRPYMYANTTPDALEQERDSRLARVLEEPTPNRASLEQVLAFDTFARVSRFLDSRIIALKEPHDRARLIEICTATLTQYVGHESSEYDEGLKHLYQVMRETKTVDETVRKFQKMVPTSQCMRVLERFVYTAFGNDEKAILALVRLLIGEDKLTSIATLIVEAHAETPRFCGYFWHDCFVQGEEEALLAKKIMELMGERFFMLFTSYQEWHFWMVRSLWEQDNATQDHAPQDRAKSDSNSCKELFSQTLSHLCHSAEVHSTEVQSQKLHILQNLCKTFSKLFPLSELLQEATSRAKVLYTKESVLGTSVDWQLLCRIRPDFLDQAVIWKIEAIFSSADKNKRIGLHYLLEGIYRAVNSREWHIGFFERNPHYRERVVKALEADISEALICSSLLRSITP